MATNYACHKCNRAPSTDGNTIERVNPIGEVPARWECRPACATTATIDCRCAGPDFDEDTPCPVPGHMDHKARLEAAIEVARSLPVSDVEHMPIKPDPRDAEIERLRAEVARLAEREPMEIHDVDGVTVEPRVFPTGWAVFTGCEGDDPTFRAFFADKESATLYLAACEDSDADWYLCDPQIVPAVIIDGAIVAANHYDDAEGVEALIKLAKVNDNDAAPWREEARR